MLKTLVVLALSGIVSAQKCGQGTTYDAKTDTCVADTVLSKTRRSTGPTIRSEGGNVVISVTEDGKKVGYSIGGKTVYFDEMEQELQGYTDSIVPAIKLGYSIGGSTQDVLDYLKDDLSRRVDNISASNVLLGAKVDKSLEDIQTTLDETSDEIDEKVAADIKAINESVASQLLAQEKFLNDTVKDILDRLVEVEEEFKCEKGYSYSSSTKKCTLALGMASNNPAKTCMHIYKSVGELNLPADGFYWVKPGASAAYQIYCTFKGEYKGAGLLIRRPGNVGGMERISAARGMPCDRNGGKGSRAYCKLSDAQINEYRLHSDHLDAYISLSYKSNTQPPRCRNFINRECVFQLNTRAHDSCKANPNGRNSGTYCRKSQQTSSYRGFDSHRCNSHQPINYNVAYAGNPFLIFEHAGGTHYCGGWDTTWSKIELWSN